MRPRPVTESKQRKKDNNKDLHLRKSFIIAEIKFMPPNSSLRTFKKLLSVGCKKNADG